MLTHRGPSGLRILKLHKHSSYCTMTDSWQANMDMIAYLYVCGSCEEAQKLN